MKRFLNLVVITVLIAGVAAVALGAWTDITGETRAKLSTGLRHRAGQSLTAATGSNATGLFTWPGGAKRVVALISNTDTATAFSAFTCRSYLTLNDGSTLGLLSVPLAVAAGNTLQTLAHGQTAILIWEDEFVPDNLLCSVTAGDTHGLDAKILIQVDQ